VLVHQAQARASQTLFEKFYPCRVPGDVGVVTTNKTLNRQRNAKLTCLRDVFITLA
jgi:hypothetical protein